MVVAAPVHNGQTSVFEETLEADHRGMKAETIGDFDHLSLGDAQLRTCTVVGSVAEWDDGVQAVVAARQLDDHENAVGMPLDAGALQGLRGERGGCPAE